MWHLLKNIAIVFLLTKVCEENTSFFIFCKNAFFLAMFNTTYYGTTAENQSRIDELFKKHNWTVTNFTNIDWEHLELEECKL